MNQKTIVTKGRTDARGELEAVFSTFDVVDSQGDVVKASAFTDGQAVPLTWSHDWDRPIGHGVVRVERDRAVFKGKLWLDTQDGLESFKKIKNNPGQEFSWGFTILEAEPGVHAGVPVRVITKTIVHEVSPVLVGAGVGTHVLAVKGTPAGHTRRPDPALVAIRDGFYGRDGVERAELLALKAKREAREAHEHSVLADLRARTLRTMSRGGYR